MHVHDRSTQPCIDATQTVNLVIDTGSPLTSGSVAVAANRSSESLLLGNPLLPALRSVARLAPDEIAETASIDWPPAGPLLDWSCNRHIWLRAR